ncbi:MAG: hypothetical protein QM766_14275 [Burkholderiaceae bacterium]
MLATATGYAALEEKPAPYRDGLPNAAIDRRIRIGAPGQNPVRSLQPLDGGRWLVAGMRGSPGTHTADADPALLRADGYVPEIAQP